MCLADLTKRMIMYKVYIFVYTDKSTAHSTRTNLKITSVRVGVAISSGKTPYSGIHNQNYSTAFCPCNTPLSDSVYVSPM